MQQKSRDKAVMTAAGWGVAFLVFFPILWMALTAFKTEIDAVSNPPKLFFTPTLENFTAVGERVNYYQSVFNSVVESVGATIVCLLFAMPAAYAMAFYPGQQDQGPVDVDAIHQDDAGGGRAGADVPDLPQHRAARHPDRHDHHLLPDRTCRSWCGCFIRSSARCPRRSSRPRAWMAPTPRQQLLLNCCCRLSLPGVMSTALLSIILCWNEAFWSINLTAAKAAPLTAAYRQVLEPGGPVLGQALGGLVARDRADPRVRLVDTTTTRARPHLRRGQIGKQTWRRSHSETSGRATARSTSSRVSTWPSRTANSWSSSARPDAVSPPCCA